jgi:RNA polymerase sigma-70 factor (ECF subfamily)
MQTATFSTASVDTRDHRTASALEGLSDENLVRRCSAGDNHAFDALLRRYERPIYHLAYRLAGNHDDAHDVAAEAAIRIYRSIGSFRCAITLPAWINRIVANVFYDMRRRQQRHPATSLDALVEKTGGKLLASKASRATSPEVHAEENEKSRILGDAIRALPAYQRTMVTLFHSEGRTYEEIAGKMNIPVGTVKSRLNRARLALRELLTPQISALTN